MLKINFLAFGLNLYTDKSIMVCSKTLGLTNKCCYLSIFFLRSLSAPISVTPLIKLLICFTTSFSSGVRGTYLLRAI